MVRSGAGLGPGLVRVIGRTRPWPGLARGEALGVPQHSALGPPNITNYRGARGDTSSATEDESHSHRTAFPHGKAPLGRPVWVLSWLPWAGHSTRTACAAWPTVGAAQARSADAPRAEGVHVGPRRVARSLHGLLRIKARRIWPARGAGQLRQADLVTRTSPATSARDGLRSLRGRRCLP